MKLYFSKKPERIKRLAKLALDNNLHACGMMWDWLQGPEYITAIVLLYDGNIPVGCGTIINDTVSYNVGVFVKLNYRRRGFGTKIYEKLLKLTSLPIRHNQSSIYKKVDNAILITKRRAIVKRDTSLAH